MSPVPDEDPDKQGIEDIEDMDTPNMVMPAVMEDSEDEEEDTVPQGYQPLSQGPEDMNGNNFDEDSDDDSGMSEGEETGGQNVAMGTGIVPSGLYPNYPEGDLPSYLQVISVQIVRISFFYGMNLDGWMDLVWPLFEKEVDVQNDKNGFSFDNSFMFPFYLII